MTTTFTKGDTIQITITVQEALAQAALEIGAVGKNQQMSAGPARYNYRGLDDLMDAVHDPLARNGVTFSPHAIVIIDKMEKTTKSGSTQYHLRAFVQYRVYGPAGDFIEATVIAEGTDTGDKAGNKLMSGAYKYALGQVLSIPFSMDDQDATLSEPVEQVTTPEIHDTGDAITVIEIAATKLGKTLNEVTAKLREEQGAIGVDELPELPFETLKNFAVRLAIYAAKQGA